jgi:uncharacterized cupin superfamily protein
MAGEPTLLIDTRKAELFSGMVASFAASGAPHHL